MEKIQVLIIKDAHGATLTIPASHVTRKGSRAIWFGQTCRVIGSDRWFIAELSKVLTREEVNEFAKAMVGDLSIMDTLDGRESLIIFKDQRAFDHLNHLTKSQPVSLSTEGGKANR